MRKAFNFYLSYWEVAKELNDKDRLAFYDALLRKQFTNEDTQLNGMVKFAYLSQKHSIDKQIDGYISQMSKRHPNEDPWQGGMQGAYVEPTQQEKEEVKEKVKDIPEFSEFLKYAIEKEPKVDKQAVKHKYESWLVSGWCTNVKGKEHKIKNWKSTLLNTLSYLPKEQTQQERTIID
jgi:hypothetical protein